jgi:hypothetical protein
MVVRRFVHLLACFIESTPTVKTGLPTEILKNILKTLKVQIFV